MELPKFSKALENNFLQHSSELLAHIKIAWILEK